jgi:hypothetical protein
LLTENQIKEELSVAYIHAIAAKVGFSCERPKIDMDSVDVEIKSHGYLTHDSTIYSPEIKLQLKSTSCINMIGDNIHFSLQINNYEALRSNSMTPRLLVIFELPANKDDWIHHTSEELIMRKCAYWVNLSGKPDTQNQSSVTVKIPKQQVLSPNELYQLMLSASKEEL